MNALTERLRHHVTGAIERGEAEAVVEVRVPTRKQYMDGEVSHHTFYKSVAQHAGLLDKPKDTTLLERCRTAYLFEQDLHLNSVSLGRWDGIAAVHQQAITQSLRLHGDFWSQAGGVCTIKAAMVEAIMLDGKGPL